MRGVLNNMIETTVQHSVDIEKFKDITKKKNNTNYTQISRALDEELDQSITNSYETFSKDNYSEFLEFYKKLKEASPPESDIHTRFTKSLEKAKPGYYSWNRTSDGGVYGEADLHGTHHRTRFAIATNNFFQQVKNIFFPTRTSSGCRSPIPKGFTADYSNIN